MENMMLPIIFIHFSLFIVAYSNPEENVGKFSEFINTFFGIKPSSPSNSHTQAQHLSYEELSKFLFHVEQKVANGVLQEGQPRIDGIYNVFQNAITTKESSLMAKFLPSRHNKEKQAQLKSHLTTFNENEQGKVQFLMLLLSFATRVAFTIGSEALKKQRRPWNRKIQMNSFLQAYEKMEKEFPVENENQENYGYDANYRHYYSANLYPNDKDNKMSFELLTIDPTTNEGRRTPHMRKYNQKKLRLLSQQKHRVSRLIKVLEQIDQYSPDHQNLSAVDIFFTNFMKFWTQRSYPDPEYTKVKMLALKRFGINLASRILRQDNWDTREYFRYYKNAKNKLLSLLAKLKDAVNELGPIDTEAEVKFMNEHEMYMHYEDAIELNLAWHIHIRPDVNLFIMKCNTYLEICILNPTNIDVNKAKIEEIKNDFLNENKAILESFMINTAPLEHYINQVLASMAAPVNQANLAHNMANLSLQIMNLYIRFNDVIQEEFDGL